jgi:hypothetical protein
VVLIAGLEEWSQQQQAWCRREDREAWGGRLAGAGAAEPEMAARGRMQSWEGGNTARENYQSHTYRV